MPASDEMESGFSQVKERRFSTAEFMEGGFKPPFLV
jgi:hypothetical protein